MKWKVAILLGAIFVLPTESLRVLHADEHLPTVSGNCVYHTAVDYAVDNVGGGTGGRYTGGVTHFNFGGRTDQCWDGHLGISDGFYVDDGDGYTEFITHTILTMYDPSPSLVSEHTADFPHPLIPTWTTGAETNLGYAQFTYADDGSEGVIIDWEAINGSDETKEVTACFYVDFDVGGTFDDNVAGFDDSRSMVYIQDTDEDYSTAALAVIYGDLGNWILSTHGSPVSPDDEGGGEEAKLDFVLGNTGGDYTDATPQDCDAAVAIDVGVLLPDEGRYIAFAVTGAIGEDPDAALAQVEASIDQAHALYPSLSLFTNDPPAFRGKAVPVEENYPWSDPFLPVPVDWNQGGNSLEVPWK